MSSFLFATWHGGYHAVPALALAKRLARRDHDVRVILPGTLVDRAANEYEIITGDSVPEWRPRHGHLIWQQGRELRRYLCGPEWRDAVAAELTRRPAGVFVCDQQLASATVAAAERETPTALLVVTSFNVWYHHWGNRALDGETTRDLLGRVALVLSVVPPELDFGADEEPPPTLRYAGPVSDPDPVAPFEASWPDGVEGPLVVITFSTVYQGQDLALAEVVEAVAELPVRALLLAGKGLDVPTPPHVVTRRWVPHAAVMPQASVCVTHGGCGTTMSALASGVPLLVMPHTTEQAATGMRVDELGAGKLISADAPAAEVREWVVELLDNPSYRENATRISPWFADDSERAVEVLEALAAQA